MLSDKLRASGVVGAGGAGFPVHVKARSQVEFMVVNGAECEPLIHKDAEIMKHFPGPILDGAEAMRQATGAQRTKFGVKTKNQESIDALKAANRHAAVDWVELGDFYPSGDEYELVYTATGRLIPAAGIPLAVGCVVNNVETLYNVTEALAGRPVTHKFVSIAGAVREPKSFWVPVGVTFRELIALAGGASVPEFGIFVSGLMMGTFTWDQDDVVTKTTAGLILLPSDHYLITRRVRTQVEMNQIGKSACDQCSYCTEFCPRYLLGYEVQPHKVMRSLGFTMSGEAYWNQWADLCCSCGLCTLYACPEDLYPKEACDDGKKYLRQAGIKFQQQHPVQVHPMKEYRRVPLLQLRRRLKVDEYERDTPYEEIRYQPSKVRLKLKQHAGKPAAPVVKVGQRVKAGALVADLPEADLGCPVHASIAGTVSAVTADSIEVTA
ncbi:MAG: NADH dehydrogenase subunit [Acidobacteria bacterium]|nr:NADH dehydrogenase subunit [Acidobacteriota bacterium]